MRTKKFALALVGLLAAGSTAACSDDKGADTAHPSSTGAVKGGGSGTAKVGVILPDTKSSQRWGTDDPKFLKAAFDAAGVPVEIENAQGDKTRFRAIADRMISGGVKVLMIVNLDSGSGKGVLDKAHAAGIATVDYDRLTLNGGADYYISFDNVQVGKLQGQGLIDCLAQQSHPGPPVVVDLNGSPTDNNATQFKEGYESVLQPRYDDGSYLKGPDQDVPDWSSTEAGAIFEQMMRDTNGRIHGVVAANDGLANAVIAVLKKNRLNGRVPVTGQDATVQGLQNILAGDQCMTVYKSIKQEAQRAADLAIQLYKGQKPDASDRIKDPESGGYVSAVLLQPQMITRKNVSRVIQDGFADRRSVCAGAYARLCHASGI
jgi:D-xylose transport system substrate-binding protein